MTEESRLEHRLEVSVKEVQKRLRGKFGARRCRDSQNKTKNGERKWKW